MKTQYRLQSPGAYLVKDGEKKLKGDKNYFAEEIDGWSSPVHKIVVTNLSTQEVKTYFPGEPIRAAEPKKKAPAKRKPRSTKKDK